MPAACTGSPSPAFMTNHCRGSTPCYNRRRPFFGRPLWQRRAEAVTEPTILIVNGPNLNLLGVREPEVYGSDTLGDIEAACAERAEELGLAIDFRQSNAEGEMVTWIQDARTVHDGLIINAGAYSHTSIAILDALLTLDMPIIEVR